MGPVQSIELKMGTLSLREDGILILEITLNGDLNRRLMGELWGAVEGMNLRPGNILMLVKHMVSHSLSLEAQRDIITRNEFKAVAIFAPRASFLRIDRMLCQISKTDFPMRAFGSEEEAIGWLKGADD